MKYYDLDVRVSSQVEDYHPVRADSESMGQAEGKLELTHVDRLYSKLSEVASMGANEAALNGVGGDMFKALFADSIGVLYQQALGQVNVRPDEGVRIRLRIEPPQIAALPWELLYDADRNCFLATSKKTPLLRYMDLHRPVRELQTALPLKILIAIPGDSGLDVQQEKKKVLEALASLQGAIEVDVLEGSVTSEGISRALVMKQFHVLHFIGHGAFRDDKGCLTLNDAQNGHDDLVSAREFAYHFQDYPSMKLIVLNSCSGAKSAKGALTGVAQELVRIGIPAVVAMREIVTDEAAKLFAANFYFQLCFGDDRGRVDIAVSHARNRLIAELADSEEFSNPILFMRSPTGIIFDLGEGAPVTSLPQLHTNNAISHTIDYNVAQLKNQGGAENAEDIAKELRAQSQVRARIVGFYKRVAIAAAPRVLAMGLLLVFVFFVASYTKILNAFQVDDYVNSLVRSWAPTPETLLHQDVRVVLARQHDNGELGSPVENRVWRKYHTALIDGWANSEQRPRAIVLDLGFFKPAPDYDLDFARAIISARSRSVEVVGGQAIGVDGNFQGNSEFNSTLKPAFGESWGDVAIARELDLPLLGKHRVATEYEIASLPKDWASRTEVDVVPSLALKAIMQAYNDPASPPRATFDEAEGELVLKAGNAANPIERRIPVIRKELSLDMLLVSVPRSALKNNTREYKDVYTWATSNNPDEKQHLEREFKNTIVLIGYDTQSDMRAVIQGEPRSGAEVHANVVSNVLNKAYISELPLWARLLVIAVMVALGMLLQTHLKKLVPADFQLELPYLGKVRVPIILTITIILYLLATYLVYSRSLVTVDMSYHIAALLFGYWMVAIFRRQLRLGAGAQEK